MNESNNDNNNCYRCINPYKVFNGGGGGWKVHTK